MTIDSPIYITRIECPVCQQINEFETLKPDACVESSRDTDFRPVERRWRHPGYQHINPLVYGMATCVSCYYTQELNTHYRNWTRDVGFKLYRQRELREAHMRALSAANGLMKALGEHLDLSAHPHETGINKLLLGILDEGLLPGGDGLNSARFYLRIAWLFQEPGAPGVRIDDELRRRSGVCEAVRDHVAEGRRWLTAYRSLAADLTREFPDTGNIPDLEPELAQKLETLCDRWDDFLRRTDPTPQVAADGGRYFDFANHHGFLTFLRDQWADVPRCASEASQLALRHYIRFFENGRRFASPEQEVQTAYLIAELGRRTHQADLAADYFALATRKGQALIEELHKDPQRTRYLRNLVEMSIEQAKKNREPRAIAV